MNKLKLLVTLVVSGAFLLLLGSTAVLLTTAAPSATTPELHYACVHQGSNKMSYTVSPQCGNNETLVTISPSNPILVCAKPNDVRLGGCNGAGTELTIPSTSGPVYFCADNKKGGLRYVTDPGQCSSKETAVVVSKANQPPTNITLSNSSVAENQPAGTTVGTFSTTDPDAGDTFTYSLVAGTGSADNAAFTISGNTLKTAASFDYETKSSYSIRVQTNDGHGGVYQKQFTISVTNVNEAPTNITLSNSSVAENQPSGTTVGTFSTTDPDPGDTFTYSLVAGTGSADNASFTISGNSLKTAASFDYEAQSSYSIRVRSTDGGGLYTEKQFTITVADVNEAPTDISLSNSSVDEGQPAGTVVGAFSTTDPDPADTFTYSLVAGTGSADNASFTISGNTLETNAVFNYATKSSYSIRVRSTDSGGLYTEKQFTITVNQVNNAPLDITLSNSSVDENQPAATTVGTFSTTDPDPGDTFTYTLVTGAGDDDNASFTISGDTLKTAASFDYETKTSYTIRVRSTDNGGLNTEKQFQIDVNPVNEPPVAAIKSFTVQANMKIALGGLLAGASDPDASDPGYTPVFTLVDVTPDSCSGCAISNVNSAAGSFDFDPPAGGSGNYTLKYRVADSGYPAPGVNSDYATINISVMGPVIWFVNPAAASNGDGRLSSPFNTLAAADAVDAANQRIFVYSGNASSGIVLNAGEWLVGQGVSGASFDSVMGINPPAGTIARPGVNGARPIIAGGVTMASSSVVRGLNIQPASGVGLGANGVSGLTVGEVGVTTVDTTAVSLANIGGSALVTQSSFQAGAGDDVRVENSSGTLDRITFDNDTFNSNGASGDNNLAILAHAGATLKATIQNSAFTASHNNGLLFRATDSAVMDLVFSGNAVSNNHPAILSGALNILVSMGGSGLAATITYDISNNTFRDASGAAITVSKDAASGGVMTGAIANNTIGVSGVANSGSAQGSGIVASIEGGGSHNVSITNNTIYQFSNYGIQLRGGNSVAGGGQGYLTAVVKGNTVAEPSPNSVSSGFPTTGLQINAGTNSGDNTKFCLTLGGAAVADKNTVPATGTNFGSDIRLAESRAVLLAVTGYVGANNSNSAMTAYLLSQNVATSASATNNVSQGGSGFLGSCP